MRRSTTARLYWTPAILALATTVALLAGCGTGASPSPSGNGLLSSAPSVSPSSGATSTNPTATNNSSSSPTTGTSAAGFPKDANLYALELLRAWANGDFNRLSQLAVQSAVQQIRDSIKFGGAPNAQWSLVACGPGDTSSLTNCSYRNAHGDEVTVKLNKTQLGFPTAVTEAPMTRTEYPSDPGTYAVEFIGAWRDGNRQRMARLSSPAIRDAVLASGTPLMAYMQGTASGAPGFTNVSFSGLASDAGRELAFKVASTPGGKAGAITGFCKIGGCTP